MPFVNGRPGYNLIAKRPEMSEEIIIGPGQCSQCGRSADYNELCETCANSEVKSLRSIASQNANTAEFLLKERDELRTKLEAARKALEVIVETDEASLVHLKRMGIFPDLTIVNKAKEALKQIGEA